MKNYYHCDPQTYANHCTCNTSVGSSDLPETDSCCCTATEQTAAEQYRPNLALAIATVPMQQWRETYNVETALKKGTVFPELFLPFQGRKGCSR